MSLEELGNTPKTRRDFLKFLGLATGTAVGSVLFKEFFSSEPAEAKPPKSVCTSHCLKTAIRDGNIVCVKKTVSCKPTKDLYQSRLNKIL